VPAELRAFGQHWGFGVDELQWLAQWTPEVQREVLARFNPKSTGTDKEDHLRAKLRAFTRMVQGGQWTGAQARSRIKPTPLLPPRPVEPQELFAGLELFVKLWVIDTATEEFLKRLPLHVQEKVCEEFTGEDVDNVNFAAIAYELPTEIHERDQLFVSGLPWEASDEFLWRFFGQWGLVKHCRLLRSEGRPGQAALVKMGDEHQARTVLEDCHEETPPGLPGPLSVRYATSQKPGQREQRNKSAPLPECTELPGRVCAWNYGRGFGGPGFGWVVPEGAGPDVFMHGSVLEGGHTAAQQLAIGAQVLFEAAFNSEKNQYAATRVSVVEQADLSENANRALCKAVRRFSRLYVNPVSLFPEGMAPRRIAPPGRLPAVPGRVPAVPGRLPGGSDDRGNGAGDWARQRLPASGANEEQKGAKQTWQRWPDGSKAATWEEAATWGEDRQLKEARSEVQQDADEGDHAEAVHADGGDESAAVNADGDDIDDLTELDIILL